MTSIIYDIEALKKELKEEIQKLKGLEIFTDEEKQLYLNDIPLFAKNELGINLSPDQAEFLKTMSDLDVKDVIIGGSRGSGKSIAVAILALWSAVFLGEKFDGYLVSILGGSTTQAQITYSYIKEFVLSNPKLKQLIVDKPRKMKTEFINGSKIIVYRSSQKFTRGYHPDLLICEEAAESDRLEGSEVLKSALTSISSAKHGRRVLISSLHYMRGVFGQYWLHAEELGFKKYRWTSEIGKRTWIPLEEQIREWNRAKNDPYVNFDVEWLAQPSQELRFIHNADLIDALTTQLRDKDFDEYWIGVDFGFHPAPTVVTLLGKITVDNKTQYGVVKQEIRHKAGLEEICQYIKLLAEQYGLFKVFCDSTGVLYIDRLRELGLQVNPVPFQRDREMLVAKLNLMIENSEIVFSSSCKELIRQMKSMHRDSDGRLSKGDDDCYDSLLTGIKYVLEKKATISFSYVYM